MDGAAFIDFVAPIAVQLVVREMHAQNTAYGEQIFVRGEFDGKAVEFYAPAELEYQMRNAGIKVGDTILVKYFGKRRVDGVTQQQFFVEVVK